MNPLDRARLGGSGVAVTRLGLGLAPIGGLYELVPADVARATVEEAWRLGVRHFDTAPMYGYGRSERLAGEVLAGKPRAEFTVATKVGRLVVPGAQTGDDGLPAAPERALRWAFGAADTRRSYAESLDRLGLSRVDVLHVHDPIGHAAEALAGALPALVGLRAEGRIGAVSVGTYVPGLLADFVRTGQLDCILLASRYTLLDQSALAELLPLCAARGVSVIAGSVYNSGLLADPSPGARYNYRPAGAPDLDRALAFQAVCDRHGVPLRAAAAQFPFGHPAVVGVLVGARSPAEVADAVAMLRVDLPGQLWTDLKRAGLLPGEVPVPAA